MASDKIGRNSSTVPEATTCNNPVRVTVLLVPVLIWVTVNVTVKIPAFENCIFGLAEPDEVAEVKETVAGVVSKLVTVHKNTESDTGMFVKLVKVTISPGDICVVTAGEKLTIK